MNIEPKLSGCGQLKPSMWQRCLRLPRHCQKHSLYVSFGNFSFKVFDMPRVFRFSLDGVFRSWRSTEQKRINCEQPKRSPWQRCLKFLRRIVYQIVLVARAEVSNSILRDLHSFFYFFPRNLPRMPIQRIVFHSCFVHCLIVLGC